MQRSARPSWPKRNWRAGPADIAIVGDEAAVDAEIDRLRDVGVTDFDAAIVPIDAETDGRTLDYLQSKL